MSKPLLGLKQEEVIFLDDNSPQHLTNAIHNLVETYNLEMLANDQKFVFAEVY